MPAVIVQIDGWDPATSAAVTIRACSHNDPSVCHLDGKTWWPVLSKLPALRYDLFDGSFGTSITAPSSDLTLSIEPWAMFARYSLADAQIQLWTGEPGAPFAQWTRRMVGRLSEQPQIANAIASISFAVDDSWLDTPLLALYAGTTGAEGEAAQKGTPKPLALGLPRYVPGVMIDSVNTILQLSSYGAVQSIDVAMEKLSRFSASIGNYANFADLKAATIPPGRWATCLSAGLVRHGAPIEGQPSYLMRGDRAGSMGWARLPGAIIKRIAEIAGAGDRVSAASLAALDAARPWPLSLWLDQQVTPRAIIQRIAASVNAVAGVSWLGELFVVPIEIGAPLATLNTDGSSLPQVGDVSQVVAGQPFWRLALQAERTWQVHGLSDVAFTAPLIDRGRYDPLETYREGNIVDLENGSRWLYAAATPSAGNAPSLDSGYWAALSGAIRATYDDGTPVEDLKPAAPGADVTGDNTSKDTHAVNGRAAADLVAALDVNVTSIIEQALRQDDFLQVVQAWAFVQGQPVSAAFLSFKNSQTDANAGFASASDFNSVFAKAPNGTGYSMNLQAVKAGNATFGDLISSYDSSIQANAVGIDTVNRDLGNTNGAIGGLRNDLGSTNGAVGGLRNDLSSTNGAVNSLETGVGTLTSQYGILSQNLTQIAALAGTTSSSVTQLQQAFANDSGGYSKFLLAARVDAGGRVNIAGISGAAGNTSSELSFVASNFYFTDPNGGNARNVLTYVNGVWKMAAIEVDTLKVNTAVVPKVVTATAQLGGSGGTNFSTVLSTSLTMPRDGLVFVSGAANQGFTSDGSWNFVLLINGTVVWQPGGTKPGDTVAITGALFCPAGTVTVELQWAGAAPVTLKSRFFAVQCFQGTA